MFSFFYYKTAFPTFTNDNSDSTQQEKSSKLAPKYDSHNFISIAGRKMNLIVDGRDSDAQNTQSCK